MITEASEIGSEAVSRLAPLFIGIVLIPIFPVSGNNITPPLIPLLFAKICNLFKPTGDCHETKSLPVIFFSIFLPLIPLAFMSTSILSPVKVKIGRDPVKFALQLLIGSEAAVQVISLLRPNVKFERILASIS